ncbi:MAG: GPW/gp25 family protein [Oscillatoria sp. SIO1A7]|nr:GPW/gp25 family protein [Oscillatoria sp. SIO1A7]
METDSNFLGVGWTSPVQLDENGQIKMARYEDAVRQSIWTILSTSKGERVMRPNFGCGLQDLVFSSNSASTIGRITSDVRNSLIEWEPRIDVLDVQVMSDREEPNLMLVQINYQVRMTNNRFNLVYPFYIE